MSEILTGGVGMFDVGSFDVGGIGGEMEGVLGGGLFFSDCDCGLGGGCCCCFDVTSLCDICGGGCAEIGSAVAGTLLCWVVI